MAAETQDEAEYYFRSRAMWRLMRDRGRYIALPTPEEAEAYPFTEAERAIVAESMSSHLIGTPETVLEGLVQLQERTAADEIMLSTRIHSYEARVRSLTLVAEAWGLEAPPAA